MAPTTCTVGIWTFCAGSVDDALGMRGTSILWGAACPTPGFLLSNSLITVAVLQFFTQHYPSHYFRGGISSRIQAFGPASQLAENVAANNQLVSASVRNVEKAKDL